MKFLQKSSAVQLLFTSLLENQKIALKLFTLLMSNCVVIIVSRYYGNLLSGKVLDSLNAKDVIKITSMLCFASCFCVLSALLEINKRYLISVTCVRMRESLYLHYGIDALKNKNCEFVCQKMSNELQSFADGVISLITQGFEVALSFFTFIFVLYDIGGLKILGYAVVYAIVGIITTKALAKPVKRLMYKRSDAGAELRRKLVQSTEKTFEATELPSITNLVDTTILASKAERNLNLFRRIFDDFKTYFVYIVLLGSYLSGNITVGALYRAVGAFRYVMRGFAFFADNRLNLAGIEVSVQRIKEMENK